MADVDIEEPPAAVVHRWPLDLIPRSAFALIAVALTWLLIVFFGAHYADETQRELRLIPWLPYDQRVDFAYFFAGADMAWHGDAADLYPLKGELTFYPFDPIFQELTDEYDNARTLARGNYYNPPALAFLQSPLTVFSFKYAFWLFSVLAITVFAAALYLAWRHGRSLPELPLLLFGALAFKPVHEALIMGHMTLFFVLALMAGLFALRARQASLAGLAFSVLALKPQWAVLPALFLLTRREWRALAVMAVVSSFVFFVPFLITGLETFRNYVQFLRSAAEIDLRDAPHMFSWNGFLFKLEGGPFKIETTPVCGSFCWAYDAAHAVFPGPSPGLIYALVAVTAVVMLVVWWSRDFYLGAAAMVIAMLLVSTHSVWYDWSLLVVAAVFLVLRPRTRPGVGWELWIVLLALFLASGQSIDVILTPDRHLPDWHRPGLFLLTPVAFASLLWIVSVAWRDGLLRLPARLSSAPRPSAGS
jgi:hypothetical protein